MTTIKDVQIAVRPLIQRRTDLASVGRSVFIKPARHTLRGVDIESRRDPRLFAPRYSVRLLIPTTKAFPGWGSRFYQSNYSDPIARSGWNINEPDTTAHMLEIIETAIDELYAIETLDDYYEYLSRLRMPWISSTILELFEMLILAMKGDLAAALKLLEGNKTLFDYLDCPRFYAALVAADRAEMAQILHDWEATSRHTKSASSGREHHFRWRFEGEAETPQLALPTSGRPTEWYSRPVPSMSCPL
ncbi:MAG: hypothetical protein AAAB35_25625 [Phyllobacterium sp.]|uniref:hypothetical protein n=1 Tax=Phyllobacterium sp. TaxID=1871046 RepID=UPI0030F0C00B